MILATILIVGFGYIIADLIIRHAERPHDQIERGFADSDPRPTQLLISATFHAGAIDHA